MSRTDRKFHADFELLDGPRLRLTLSEEGRGVRDLIECDPFDVSAPDRLLAIFVPFPQTAPLTVTCNFPFDHWRERNRTLFCDEVVMAARVDLEQRRIKA